VRECYWAASKTHTFSRIHTTLPAQATAAMSGGITAASR